MFKRKLSSDLAASQTSSADKRAKASDHQNPAKYVNYQRTLVLSSRGTSHRDRHLMADIRDLLPHSKKDAKLDTKDQLNSVNEVADLKNCNSTIFFEARKHKDLYCWLAKTPNGPSAKFLVQNIHTMAEVKLTGNCLKGSRPLLIFDKLFDSEPQYGLLKELFTQIFGSPKGHPRIKPFIDHALSFFIADSRIWFRHYQIVYEPTQDQISQSSKNKSTSNVMSNGGIKSASESGVEPVLVEIGPRFVLNPVKIFSGSFNGATLWENPNYISPNTLRAILMARKGSKYDSRKESHAKTEINKEAAKMEPNPLDTVFEQEITKKIKESNNKRNNKKPEPEEEEEEEEEKEDDDVDIDDEEDEDDEEDGDEEEYSD